MIQDIFKLLVARYDFFLGLLTEHLAISLVVILIAIVFGGAAGILISEFRKSAKPTLGLINFLYTIPSISMLGFLIPFSGVGNTTAIIALSIYALLPMVRNTFTGMTNVDPVILEAAKGMGSTRWQILTKIQIPLAMPVIMSGVRNMAIMTISLAGIASFIGAGGLGVAIYRGITTNNAAMTMAGSLLIALLALIVDFLLGVWERHTQIHRHSRKFSAKIFAFILCLATLLVIYESFKTTRDNVLKIATKPMTEQYIIGEMLKILIERNTDIKVELTQGVGGGTANIEPAIENGEFDLYPEYTGTGWNAVLKNKEIYTEDMFETLQREYQSKLSLTWQGMYGFNNTYGLAVRTEIAKKYNLETYSDLAKISDKITFGAEYDFFEREDGYQALCERYGMKFVSTMDLDIGLKYQAIAQGKIDAINIFTTDGKLSTADVVVLEDNLNFYPSYQCGNVVRLETLKKYPQLSEQLSLLSGQISNSDMAFMNNEVESYGAEPQETALKFLQKKELVK